MASFLSCRASCSDFNVVRHCSYAFSLVTPRKGYDSSNVKEKCFSNTISYSTTTTNRQHLMRVHAVTSTSARNCNPKNNHHPTVTSLLSVTKSPVTCFQLPVIIHKNIVYLDGLITNTRNYHTYNRRTCLTHYKSSCPSVEVEAACCHFHYCVLKLYNNRQLHSLLPRRFFSVGKKQSHTHYYDVLGLTSKATQKQIKTAYYDLSKKHHPDVSQNKTSHVLFTEISEAYQVLGNIQKRRLYDKGMFSQRGQRVRDYDYAEEDYTQSYKEKTSQSPFERGDRPPPPTGRSKVYNFDEFYKQHYNEIRERRKQEFATFQKQQARNEFFDGRQRKQNSIVKPVLVSIFFTLMVIVSFLNERRYDVNKLHSRDTDKKDR